MSHSLTYKSSGVSPPSACYVYSGHSRPGPCVTRRVRACICAHPCLLACTRTVMRIRLGISRVAGVYLLLGMCQSDASSTASCERMTRGFPPLLERRLVVGQVMKLLKYVWCLRGELVGQCAKKVVFVCTRRASIWDFQAVMILK